MNEVEFLAASVTDFSVAIAVTSALFCAWFLTRRRHLYGVLAAIVVGFVLVHFYTVQQLSLRYEADAQRQAVTRLVDVGQRLESTLEARIVEARAVAAYAGANPGLNQAEYARFVDNLLAQPELYTNLAVAPELTIQLIFPERGNELARGLYYPDVNSQWPMVQRAIQTQQPVLIGPIELVQGGTGFIIHQAMLDEQLQPTGVIAAVLPLAAILRSSGILALEQTYTVNIVARSDEMAEAAVIWGSDTSSETQWATHTATVPNGEWLFNLTPTSPQTLPSGVRWSVHTVFLLLLLASALVTVLLARSRDESRAATERLQTTAYMLDEAQRVGGMGSWTLTLPSDTFRLSPQLQQLLGAPDRIRLDDWRALIPGPIGHEVVGALSELSQHGYKALSLEHPLITRMGLRTLQHTAELAQPRGSQGATMVVGTLIDISEKKKTEEQLEHLAYFDSLTRIPNRYYFKQTLENHLLEHRTQQHRLALLHIDLDHFKDINDSLGHQVGDDVLRIVSKIIRSALKSRDVVARTGGDEFMVVLPNIVDSAAASGVAARIIAALNRPLAVRSHAVFVGASIGIALYPDHARSYEAMYQRADLALYRAKAHGRGNFQLYAEHLAEDFNRRTSLEKALRLALENHEFHLEYQPRVDLTTGNVKGLETLLRWQDAAHGMVTPDEFIPIAEASGQILPLGRWVLRQAMTEFQAVRMAMPADVCLSINLSPRQIQSSDLYLDIMDALKHSGLPPERLELEITETFIISDYEQCETFMRRLSEHGVQFSLDDFGTGYSNLVSLRTLPLAALKIDKSFVQDIASDSNHRTIVEAIIQLGTNLGMVVVAEGIERMEQKDILGQLSCHEGQGYWFARPAPLPAVMNHWFKAPGA